MVNANPTPKCFIVHVNISNNEAISLLSMGFGMPWYDSPLTGNYCNIYTKMQHPVRNSGYRTISVLSEKSCSPHTAHVELISNTALSCLLNGWGTWGSNVFCRKDTGSESGMKLRKMLIFPSI